LSVWCFLTYFYYEFNLKNFHYSEDTDAVEKASIHNLI
jgi:hypothetical protein